MRSTPPREAADQRTAHAARRRGYSRNSKEIAEDEGTCPRAIPSTNRALRRAWTECCLTGGLPSPEAKFYDCPLGTAREAKRGCQGIFVTLGLVSDFENHSLDSQLYCPCNGCIYWFNGH